MCETLCLHTISNSEVLTRATYSVFLLLFIVQVFIQLRKLLPPVQLLVDLACVAHTVGGALPVSRLCALESAECDLHRGTGHVMMHLQELIALTSLPSP